MSRSGTSVEEDVFVRSTSFLSMTNDAICTAVTKAIRLVSQPQEQKTTFEERAKGAPLKFENKDSLPEITLDEVSWHDHRKDCWIVVYDRVFDITEFLQEHPGGEEVLLEHAGHDATLAFRGIGHSSEALQALEVYLIGILPEEERIYSKGGKKMLEILTTTFG